MKMLNRKIIMSMLLALPGNGSVITRCSPYFAFGHLVSQHPVIFVRDIEASILELLVRYMYSGQVGTTTVYIASSM